MGYNSWAITHARNGKSISKIPKWQSLRSLALRSKFVRQFEFWENLEYIYGNSCWRARLCSLQQLFPYKSSYFFKNSNRHKIAFFTARGFFDVSDKLFPFLAFLKLQPIILRKYITWWLSCKGPIHITKYLTYSVECFEGISS